MTKEWVSALKTIHAWFGKRLREHDDEIEALREEIKQLKAAPRIPLAQKLRMKRD
jgi:hypothetical protein